MTDSSVTWCVNNHLKLEIQETDEVQMENADILKVVSPILNEDLFSFTHPNVKYGHRFWVVGQMCDFSHGEDHGYEMSSSVRKRHRQMYRREPGRKTDPSKHHFYLMEGII